MGLAGYGVAMGSGGLAGAGMGGYDAYQDTKKCSTPKEKKSEACKSGLSHITEGAVGGGLAGASIGAYMKEAMD